MARYDVFTNPDGGVAPYLLDVQSDLLDGLNTRIAVPLIRVSAFPKPATRLHPVFQIEGQAVVMATHLMASVAISELRHPVASLDEEDQAIGAALDMIF